jgi:short-subunit dehydrogenase
MASYPFRTALITGASAGIGEAMARILGDAGVPCVLVARREDRLRELAAKYAGFEVLAADLTTDEGVRAVAARLRDPERPIDLLVNNAGFGTSGHFRDLDPSRLNDEISLNVQALVQLSHAAMQVMGERRRGWIMNVSSVASFQAGPSLAVYAATKAFVTNFSESIHEEGKAVGVKVTALCPGLTRTEFQSVSNTTDLQTNFPGFAWCTPEMVAKVGLADTAKGKAISVPGGIYKGLVVGSALLPRVVKRWVYRVGMKRG